MNAFFEKIKELLGLGAHEGQESFKKRRVKRERQREAEPAPSAHLPAYDEEPVLSEGPQMLIMADGDDISLLYEDLAGAIAEGHLLLLNFAGATDPVMAQNCLTQLRTMARRRRLCTYRLTSTSFLFGGTTETVVKWAAEAPEENQ